ncbi:MAG: hypothetical protein J0G96_13510 [Flavobacteriia bacterium]|nr:hypothetical protein [Flavobacteriia bacterium]OJX39612.1 MAG: hypothetical protein BGO87_11780 [Flavobacteriia bacterium 40-80]
MESYPFYIKFIRLIQFQFKLIARIRSVLNASKEEVCDKNKILAIKMMLTALDDELLEVETTVLQEEFNFTKAEVMECQQKFTALSERFTLFLN